MELTKQRRRSIGVNDRGGVWQRCLLALPAKDPVSCIFEVRVRKCVRVVDKQERTREHYRLSALHSGESHSVHPASLRPDGTAADCRGHANGEFCTVCLCPLVRHSATHRLVWSCWHFEGDSQVPASTGVSALVKSSV